MASVADAEAPLAAAEPAFSLGYRRWMLILLVSIYACSFLDRVIVSTVGPAIIKDLRLSDLQFGLLGGAAFAVFYALFGLPIARVAEKTSRIAIISTCIALWSALTALSGFAASYWQLLALRMGVGVGEGGCSPAAHSLLSDHYPPRQRATALAIYSIGVPIGTLLGSVAGGWIAQTFNWRTAFIVVGLPGLVLALLARLTLKEPARGHIDGATPLAEAPPLGAVVSRLFRTPSFRHLAAGFVLANLTGSGVNVFMSTYLVRSFHLGLAKAGLLYGLVVGASGLLGTLAGGLIADWGGKRDARWYAFAPGIGAILAFPCYVVAFTRQDAISTVACFFVGGFLLTFYLAPTLGVVQNLVEPRMRASGAALMFILINIFGQGLGPTAMGAASDVLAKRVLAPAGDLSLCGASAPAFVARACETPQVSGLQAAILAMTVFVLWGGAHFLLAARNIRKDLASARTS